tara:strand:- start:93 stop:371 length:279 start_codon:yes stop_codon:yes gene_type:complete
MKKIILILIVCSLPNSSIAADKKECKKFKKLSREYLSCIAGNIKDITLKATDKVKNDASIAANEVKNDTIKTTNKVKKGTKNLIEKTKDITN